MHMKWQNAPAQQVPSYPVCALCFIRGVAWGEGLAGIFSIFFIFYFLFFFWEGVNAIYLFVTSISSSLALL